MIVTIKDIYCLNRLDVVYFFQTPSFVPQLHQLISNTLYEVSVAAAVDAKLGVPTNTTCNIIAYLQPITTNWTLYGG